MNKNFLCPRLYPRQFVRDVMHCGHFITKTEQVCIIMFIEACFMVLDDRAVLFELQRLKLKKLLKKHNEIVKNIGTNPNAIVYRPERVEEKPVPKAVASQPPRPSRPADEAQPKLSMSQLVNESKPRPESGANTGNPNSRYAFKRDNSPAPLPPPTAQPAPKQLPPVQPKPIEDEGTVAEYKIVLTKAEHDDLRRRYD